MGVISQQNKAVILAVDGRHPISVAHGTPHPDCGALLQYADSGDFKDSVLSFLSPSVMNRFFPGFAMTPKKTSSGATCVLLTHHKTKLTEATKLKGILQCRGVAVVKSSLLVHMDLTSTWISPHQGGAVLIGCFGGGDERVASFRRQLDNSGVVSLSTSFFPHAQVRLRHELKIFLSN